MTFCGSRAMRLLAACAPLILAGCVNPVVATKSKVFAPGEAPVLMGPPVRENTTPFEPVLKCFGKWASDSQRPARVIAVGDVKDYTGKYSITEGSAITQGGALMVYSALGKIGGPYQIAERFDSNITERELNFTDRRQLGDGREYEVNGNRVPWLPYFGGTITKSDYFIVGGITELNYNLSSGGAEAGVNNIGVKARVFTVSVAVDLRIVDSDSLIVAKTVSLTKQFHGYEVNAGLFRFFGQDLFDLNIGSKAQEPLQLGVRAALEEATFRLLTGIEKADPAECLAGYVGAPDAGEGTGSVAQETSVEAIDETLTAASSTEPERAAPTTSLNAETSSGMSMTGNALQIQFEFGETNIRGQSQAALDQIALMASKELVRVTLVARDTENWDPAKRDSLIDARLAAVITALANRGVPSGAVFVVWRPDKADSSIYRDGPGLQEIAKIEIRY